MIITALQKEIEKRLTTTKANYLGYLKNLWGANSLLIVCRDIQWTPAATEIGDWEAIRRFSGNAALAFPTERMENFDLTELIAKLCEPIQIGLDPNTLPGELGVNLQWDFNNQKDELGEFNLTTLLSGNLRGTLYKRV